MTPSEGRSEAPRRIVVVDDHPMIRSGLKELIESEPDLEVCGEAGDAPTAVRIVEERKPDLVVVDISLSEGSGIDLIKRLKAIDPALPCLVFSMHDEKLYAERVLSAGGMGYVSKQESAATLLEAVRQVLAGKVHLSPSMTERVLRGMAGGGEPAERTPIVDRLSDRELEVFESIGRGLTTREVADRLHLSIKTIQTHRENIKRKLRLESNNELIARAAQWVMRQG